MTINFLIFKLMGNQYAIPSKSVVEILRDISYSVVTNTPQYIIGASSIRGEVLPILNLREFLTTSAEQMDIWNEKSNIFVSISENDFSGLVIVDEVIGTEVISNDNLKQEILDFDTIYTLNFYKRAFLVNNVITIELSIEKIIKQVTEDLDLLIKGFNDDNVRSTSDQTLPSNYKELSIPYSPREIKYASERWGTDLESPKQTNLLLGRQSGVLILLQGQKILIPTNNVIELYNTSSIDSVSIAGNAVVGAISYRGEVISVLNLAVLLGIEEKKSEISRSINRLLIVQYQEDVYGLLVEKILELKEFQEADIRSVFTNKTNEYIFKGAILDSEEGIIPIINIEYIMQRGLNSDFYDSTPTEVVLFNNPEIKDYLNVKEVDQDGLLFLSDGNYYFLKAENVVQVLNQKSFLVKTRDNLLKGAAIHDKIIPLVSFSDLISNLANDLENKIKLTGIVMKNQEKEICFIVDRIINRENLANFKAYELHPGLSSDILPSYFSGFFSTEENIGAIIETNSLFEECESKLRSSIGNLDDFENVLSEEERKDLNNRILDRKEIERLLFKDRSSIFDTFLIFNWGENTYALDVNSIERIFNYNDVEIITPTKAKFEQKEYAIFNLRKSIIKNSEKVSAKDSFFISLKKDIEEIFIHVDHVYGVFDVYENEVNQFEAPDLFIDAENACSSSFSNEISSNIMILNNKYVNSLVR